MDFFEYFPIATLHPERIQLDHSVILFIYASVSSTAHSLIGYVGLVSEAFSPFL